MYYNSNNNDYYNAYKKELEEIQAYKKEEATLKVIKFLLLLLTFILILLASIYLYKYFNPTIETRNTLIEKQNISTPKLLIQEEVQAQAPQVNKAPSLKEQEIALIVQIIMAQMNTKVEKNIKEVPKNLINEKYTINNAYNKP